MALFNKFNQGTYRREEEDAVKKSSAVSPLERPLLIPFLLPWFMQMRDKRMEGRMSFTRVSEEGDGKVH